MFDKKIKRGYDITMIKGSGPKRDAFVIRATPAHRKLIKRGADSFGWSVNSFMVHSSLVMAQLATTKDGELQIAAKMESVLKKLLVGIEDGVERVKRSA